MTRPIDPLVAARAAGRFVGAKAKLLASIGEGAPQQATGPPLPPPKRAYNIPEFCDAVGISEAFYYDLKRTGRGPREMKLGSRRRLISLEEAIRWCAEATDDPQEEVA